MKRQLKARGIAVLNGKLLCVQLKPNPNQKHDFWCLPGGNVEETEPIIDSFRREIIEEMGVEPQIGRLLFVQQFSEPKANFEFTEFFFHIENPEDYQNIDLAKTSHGAEEITKIDFVNPAEVYVLSKFLATENLEEFISSNQPVKFFAH